MGAMMQKSRPTQVEQEFARGRRRFGRWRAEFPYHWDADEFVSRRELLRLAVMTSGALFAATAGIAALNYVKPLRTANRQLIAAASAAPAGVVHYLQYPTAHNP